MYSNALLGANSSIDPNLVTEFCLLPLKVPQETVKTFYNISVYRMTYYKLIQPFKFLKPTKGSKQCHELRNMWPFESNTCCATEFKYKNKKWTRNSALHSTRLVIEPFYEVT